MLYVQAGCLQAQLTLINADFGTGCLQVPAWVGLLVTGAETGASSHLHRNEALGKCFGMFAAEQATIPRKPHHHVFDRSYGGQFLSLEVVDNVQTSSIPLRPTPPRFGPTGLLL